MDSREAFEAWNLNNGTHPSALLRNDDGDYESRIIELKFEQWQHQQTRIDALKAELAATKAQEPVATVKLVAISRDIVTNEPLQFEAVLVDAVEMGETLEDGQKLYAAPQAPAVQEKTK